MLGNNKLIIVLIIILSGFIGKSQSVSNKGSFELSDVLICDEYLSFNIMIKNIGETDFVLYKPALEDLCNGDIFKIYLSEASTNKRHEVFPCDYVSQVVVIYLTNKSSIYLKQGEGFFKSYKVELKHITPFIAKGTYSVNVYYNTSDIHFESNFENVFKGELISKNITVDF